MAFKAKSRLCVLGFLDPDTGIRTDAPTLSKAAEHLIYAFAASKRLTLFTGDVSNAFLNGVDMDPKRSLWFRAPSDLTGVRSGALCRVRKGVYGLRDAPRLWWERLRSALLGLGFYQCRLDVTLFV